MGPSQTRKQFMELACKAYELQELELTDAEIADQLGITIYQLNAMGDMLSRNINNLTKNELYNAVHLCTLDDRLSYGTCIARALRRNGVTTCAQFVQLSKDDMLALHGVGRKYVESLSKVKRYLQTEISE